jgi:hypothetical protein
LVKRTAALPDVAAGSLALVNPVPPPTAVDDDTYRLYAALHRYDKPPLDSKVGLTDDSSQRSSCVSKLSSSPRGASWETIRPRVNSWNFAPRVQVPVLMLNGCDDFLFQLETNQKPLFRALGTKEPDKKHVLDDGGHRLVTRPDLIGAMLDWFDKYLGTVDGGWYGLSMEVGTDCRWRLVRTVDGGW